jgi:DNA polymerase
VRIQVQNLPKGLEIKNIESAIGALLSGDADGLTPRHIPTFLRACLRARERRLLTIVDYSQIEARFLAWAAGDGPALELFRTPGADPYKRLAAKIYNLPEDQIAKTSPERDLAKRAELGCGYGMGDEKFYTTTQDPKMGKVVDWANCPVNPSEVVEAYRAAHPAIVHFWRDLNDAAIEAARGGRATVGAFEFASVPGAGGQPDVWVMLPSGRPIVYHRMHQRPRSDGKRGLELVYLGQKNGQALWIKTYGGALTENLVQAGSRELLARAMVRCEAEGLEPVFHVHDELVCDVPEDQAEDALALQEWIMCDNPDWCLDLPTRCEGFIAGRYRK